MTLSVLNPAHYEIPVSSSILFAFLSKTWGKTYKANLGCALEKGSQIKDTGYTWMHIIYEMFGKSKNFF